MRLDEMLKTNKHDGFSLIELLLVISLIAILGSAITAIGQRFLVNNYLQNKKNELVSLLRTAQINSIAGKGGSSWGVSVTGSSMTLFQGTDYASRNTVFDIVYSIPSSVSVSSGEVVFSSNIGEPNTTMTYTLSGTNQSYQVQVNALGVINVN